MESNSAAWTDSEDEFGSSSEQQSVLPVVQCVPPESAGGNDGGGGQNTLTLAQVKAALRSLTQEELSEFLMVDIYTRDRRPGGHGYHALRDALVAVMQDEQKQKQLHRQ